MPRRGRLQYITRADVGAGKVLQGLPQCAGPTERGMLLGIYSSAGTLGRIIGTLSTGFIFSWIHIQGPYATCVVTMFALYFLARSVENHWKEHRDTDGDGVGEPA